MRKLRIFLVDDHSLFRRGLRTLLDEMPEFEVVADFGNVLEAVKLYSQGQADLILLDVNMPEANGVDMIAHFRETDPEVKILMLTISQEGDDLFGAIRNGANGYILKNTEPEGLRNYILNVVAGNSVLSPEITKSVMNVVKKAPMDRHEILSDRELDVLVCLGKGMKTSKVSETLFISENTVKTHIRHIMKKLEVNNRAEAVSKGKQLRLL